MFGPSGQSNPELRREWNRAKETVAPWWRENPKEAYSPRCSPDGEAPGLSGLAEALKNWRASKQGRRKGKRMGFPRFRKKGRGRESVSFTTGAIRVVPLPRRGKHRNDKSRVVLPRTGRVRTHEPKAALLEKVRAGKARILRATVVREGGRWFVSFTCEVERAPGKPKRPDAVVGVDAGLRHLAVLSTGERVPNPRPLKEALEQALNNLAYNALFHGMGTVWIRTFQQGPFAVLEAEDEGPGLPKNRREGLGLKVAQAVAQALGADLSLENTRGLRVRFIFPGHPD